MSQTCAWILPFPWAGTGNISLDCDQPSPALGPAKDRRTVVIGTRSGQAGISPRRSRPTYLDDLNSLIRIVRGVDRKIWVFVVLHQGENTVSRTLVFSCIEIGITGLTHPTSRTVFGPAWDEHFSNRYVQTYIRFAASDELGKFRSEPIPVFEETGVSTVLRSSEVHAQRLFRAICPRTTSSPIALATPRGEHPSRKSHVACSQFGRRTTRTFDFGE